MRGGQGHGEGWMERRWGGGERGGWRGDGDGEEDGRGTGWEGWTGDGREGGEGRPRGNRLRMVPQGASSVGGSQVRDVRQTAPWVTSRQGHWDVIRRIMARGRRVSPILQVPWVDIRIFRIDWLHAVQDQRDDNLAPLPNQSWQRPVQGNGGRASIEGVPGARRSR